MRFQTNGLEPVIHDRELAFAMQLYDQCERWKSTAKMPVDPTLLNIVLPDCNIEKLNNGPLKSGQISVAVDAASLKDRLANAYDLINVGEIGSFLERVSKNAV